MSKEVRDFFEGWKTGKDIQLPKEAVLHRMHDERNIPEAPTIEANVIRHVRGDMSPQHIAVSMQPERDPSALEGAKTIAGEFWDALTPAFKLGAEELSRALFTGNAYVFHGDTIPEEMKTPAKEHTPQREHERGGRSM